MVLTDILKRWQVLKGRPALLSTGTDEHGMKIQRASEAAGQPPLEFCDEVSQKFSTLAERADISNDFFIRTTNEQHKDAVQYFWTLLMDRGFIYVSKHEGWYCVSDETYYPETQIEKRLDPVTGRTFMASQETGKDVEWTSERNYHFKLSAFRDRLIDYYKSNPNFIVPQTRMNEVTQWLEAGLEDLSVSRPSSRLTWGIPVPQDDTQTIYVWLDALVNYATVAGFPSQPFFDGTGGWPADVHVIGKDIMRFHCIYWPAFLMALDLPLPKQILTHAHWTMGNTKMSKSIGNVVSPDFAMNRFGVDTMRFYLAHDGGIADDADYSNEYIVERYKKCLSGGIGNLVQRITKPKAWNLRKAVETAEGGLLAYPGAAEFRTPLESLGRRIDQRFVELDPREAVKEIMDAVFETNRFITTQEPWHIIRATHKPNHIELTDAIIFDCAEAVRITAILLQPYMPTKAAQILDKLGVDASKRNFQDAVFGSDFSYGTSTYVTEEKGEHATIFPPLLGEKEGKGKKK